MYIKVCGNHTTGLYEGDNDLRKLEKRTKKILSNGIMLMIFQVSKILFPLITLPYLTRVLSLSCYGVVSYTKSVMIYMQVWVDFGFTLSGTKAVVQNKDDKNRFNAIIGETQTARVMLGISGFIIIGVLCLALPILRGNRLFAVLSYVTVFLSIFLYDYLFRGLEKTHVIAIRFIIMKSISIALTFVFVKSDSDVLLIPLLDIISSIIAIVLVLLEVKKLDIQIKRPNIYNVWHSIQSSFVYFVSNAATSSFNALSTIVIGVLLKSEDVAYWSICMQIIGSITACYNPICDSIYPAMIETRDYSFVKRIKRVFVPVILIGCTCLFLLSEFVLRTVGGEKYVLAQLTFIALIPVCFFAFLSMLHGWPCLGAIEKNKEVTNTTIISASYNILTMIILAAVNRFTLQTLAIVRVSTEILMFITRYYYCVKYKSLFKRGN